MPIRHIPAFSVRVREERKKAGLSQVELAKRVTENLGSNLDQSAIARIERGERQVALAEAVALSEVLNLPLNMLLTESDPQAQIKAYQHEAEQLKRRIEALKAEVEQMQAEVESKRREVTELEWEMNEREEAAAKIKWDNLPASQKPPIIRPRRR